MPFRSASGPARCFPVAGRLAALLTVLAVTPGRSQAPAELDPVVVTTARSARPLTHVPVTVDVFTSDDLATTPGLTIDEALENSAAFSLFRRTSSLMANPTAQGVSLRNLGPSGAGRTLVLLDGVPLNDPFGGWIAWTKLPRLTLGRAEIVRGGGSSVWGSAALGGTVQLLTRDDADAPASEARVEAGEFSTASGELAARAGGWTVLGRAFTTDGFWRVGRADRGAIDRRTDSDHQLAQVAWSGTSDAGVTGGFTARHYREDRGNGTPLQRNRTRETFVSGRLAGVGGAGAVWTAVGYFQTQEFANRFTSVSDDRASETPALDQFAVPADAAGGAVTATWSEVTSSTTVGADVRWVRGETREAYFRQNDQFTRRRHAGGEQAFAGVFLHHERELAPRWRATVSARLDDWRNDDGRRRETDTASGAVLRDDRFAATDGTEFSPTVGIVWQARPTVRVRAAAYRAFRVPTLNELYRPFRVGNVITEANPELAVETLEGLESSIEWGDRQRSVVLTAFTNDLDEAVANVTLGAGPGVVPGVGFVPAGGLGRQRRNLDQVRVRGLELGARWRPADTWRLRLDYLLSDARVRRATGPAAGLAGNELAQVPRHTLVAGATWEPDDRWRVDVQLRALSRAFEDDANTLVLAAVTTVDFRVARTFGPGGGSAVFVAAENVLDATVEAGRDADGRVDLGAPRFVHGGVRWTW